MLGARLWQMHLQDSVPEVKAGAEHYAKNYWRPPLATMRPATKAALESRQASVKMILANVKR
jgi:phage gp46-like protein